MLPVRYLFIPVFLCFKLFYGQFDELGRYACFLGNGTYLFDSERILITIIILFRGSRCETFGTLTESFGGLPLESGGSFPNKFSFFRAYIFCAGIS